MVVYYMNITPFAEEELFQYYLPRLERQRKEAILRTRSHMARVRSLAAGSLMYEALCREEGMNSLEAPPFLVEYGEYGKPFLKEYPGLFFNMSHSGDYVACSVGKEEMGVDIQKRVKGRDRVAYRFFTQKEKRMLAEMEKEKREELFFRLWSIKESFLKLDGRGLGLGLDSFEILRQEQKIVTSEGKEAYFQEFHGVEGYYACLCTFQAEKITWKHVNIGCKDRQIKLR